MKPWKKHALVMPPKGGIGSGSRLRVVKHVTHTASALRILEDGRIARGLIYDESALNAHRTTVTWLSPNHWHHGSRYGNVEFSFDFEKLIADRQLFWVESVDYKPPACRFLITDQDVSSLPVTHYDPDKTSGPLQRIHGEWWWNAEITLEVMFDGDLSLKDCSKLDFVKHHPNMCAVDWQTCTERGQEGDVSAARVIAGVLARDSTAIDHLLVNSNGDDVSWAMDTGLCRIPFVLDAVSEKLDGPLKQKASIDSVLRAALLQLSAGDPGAARTTVGLVTNDKALLKSLSRVTHQRLGVKPKSISSTY